MTVDSVNQAVYTSPEIAVFYSKDDGLQPAEQLIFHMLKDQIIGRRVLDVGVGAGRTTKYLIALTKEYTGIDWSQRMVELCQQRFPQQRIFRADARDLSMFGNESFDFVLCSYNGIDYVSHRDRLRILGELCRVLRDGGWFVFSTHNRAFARLRRFNFRPTFKEWIWFKPRPKELVRRARLAITILKNKRLERHEKEYSILNDPAHDFRCLHYYIDPADQKRQLREVGFLGPIYMVGRRGEFVDEDDTDSCWIYYAVRKN
jgi:SAM-dependent methyltransferase